MLISANAGVASVSSNAPKHPDRTLYFGNKYSCFYHTVITRAGMSDAPLCMVMHM